MKSEKWVSDDGHIFWYKSGTNIYHREDGPALEFVNGDKYWYEDGLCHREDGPAIQKVNGQKRWYYHGEEIHCQDQETFERILKLKAFW